MLTVFFDYEGVIHHEYASEGQTVNKGTMSKFSSCWVMWCGASDLCWGSEVTGNCIATSRPNLSHFIQNFLAKHQIPKVLQPPCSPDMALCEFFLFPKVKMLLKGKRFQDMEEIKQKVITELLAIPRSQFQKCFGQWKDCWNKCLLSEGDYF
jgi:hypothetical protein